MVVILWSKWVLELERERGCVAGEKGTYFVAGDITGLGWFFICLVLWDGMSWLHNWKLFTLVPCASRSFLGISWSGSCLEA